MTSQTKHYIQLSDILAVRFECKECGAAVSLPISMKINFSRISVCPNCGNPWATIMQTSLESDLKLTADAIFRATALLTQHQKILEGAGFKGFSLALEVVQLSDPVSGDHGA
jgi:uncharacterized paraquat-inducible protein A